MEIRALDATSVADLEAFLKVAKGRRFCHFCTGGEACICGQCPEEEYHSPYCLALLLQHLVRDYYQRLRTPSQETPVPAELVLIEKRDLDWFISEIATLEQELTDTLSPPQPQEEMNPVQAMWFAREGRIARGEHADTFIPTHEQLVAQWQREAEEAARLPTLTREQLAEVFDDMDDDIPTEDG